MIGTENMCFKSKIKSEEGMTLIDLAIGMIVLGLLTVPLIQQYNQHKMAMDRFKTESYMETVKTSLEIFAKTHGRLPCPADPALNIDDANYGKERITTGTPNTCNATVANGYIGMVPFATLKISDNLVYDEFGNKLTYAVTADLVDGFTDYEDMVGDLTMLQKTVTIDAACAVTETIAPATDDRLFVILSHGSNGDGAYPAGSAVRDVCDGNGLGATVELENCDDDNVFFDETVIVQNACPTGSAGDTTMTSHAMNVDYFDDFVNYEFQFSRGTFMYSDEASDEAHYTDNTRLGIGTDDPQTRVHVEGDVRIDAPTSSVQMQRLCQQTGSFCYDPREIGGSGTVCGNGAANDFRYATVRCNAVATGMPSATCGAGEYLTGFDAGGNPICTAL